MTAPALGLDIRDSIAFVTFNRPVQRNAMTWEMYEGLFDACEQIDGDERVRAVVLRGAGGRAFVAGTDIRQFREFSGGADGIAYEERIDRVVGRLESVSVPTIAVVDGYAVGGGLIIAAACDLRLASTNAKFGLPVARTLGNAVSASTCHRLMALVGASRALQMIYTAEMVDADEAVTIGLANELVPTDELEQRVEQLCAQLKSHAPLTMRSAKLTVQRLQAREMPDTQDLLSLCYDSEDFKEGVDAFVHKRPPEWAGR